MNLLLCQLSTSTVARAASRQDYAFVDLLWTKIKTTHVTLEFCAEALNRLSAQSDMTNQVSLMSIRL